MLWVYVTSTLTALFLYSFVLQLQILGQMGCNIAIFWLGVLAEDPRCGKYCYIIVFLNQNILLGSNINSDYNIDLFWSSIEYEKVSNTLEKGHFQSFLTEKAYITYENHQDLYFWPSNFLGLSQSTFIMIPTLLLDQKMMFWVCLSSVSGTFTPTQPAQNFGVVL